MANIYRQTGLSISYSDPLVKPERSRFLGRISDKMVQLSFSKAAFGGYKDATIAFSGSVNDIERWLEQGPNRHIEISDENGIVWAGFVDSVSTALGGLIVRRENVTQIVNRTLAFYTVKNTATNPPTTGPSGVPTTLAEDTDSQDIYGIWEASVDAGTDTTTAAEQTRDSFLAQYAELETTPSFTSTGGGGTVGISLGCKGYMEYFAAYPFTQTTSSGTRTVELKLQDIISEDPNNVFSRNFAYIAANPLLISRYDNSQTTALAMIKAIVALGDANEARYTFGVYSNQEIHYQSVPEDVAYVQRLSDETSTVYVESGTADAGPAVKPWRIQPGVWLFYADFLAGKEKPNTLAKRRKDPRYEFIEEVQYTAPYGFSHSGGRTDTLAQKLAQKGLGGVT